MHPATRTQAAFKRLENSMENLAPEPAKNEPGARQEFAKEADVNNILAKFGPLAANGLRAPIWGMEIDYTADLADAYQAARDISSLYDRLPKHVQERYTAEEFNMRLATGQEIDLAETPKDEKPPADGQG